MTAARPAVISFGVLMAIYDGCLSTDMSNHVDLFLLIPHPPLFLIIQQSCTETESSWHQNSYLIPGLLMLIGHCSGQVQKYLVLTNSSINKVLLN